MFQRTSKKLCCFLTALDPFSTEVVLVLEALLSWTAAAGNMSDSKFSMYTESLHTMRLAPMIHSKVPPTSGSGRRKASFIL